MTKPCWVSFCLLLLEKCYSIFLSYTIVPNLIFCSKSTNQPQHSHIHYTFFGTWLTNINCNLCIIKSLFNFIDNSWSQALLNPLNGPPELDLRCLNCTACGSIILKLHLWNNVNFILLHMNFITLYVLQFNRT